MTFPYGEMMADCRCGAGARGNLRAEAHPKNPKLQRLVCRVCEASTGWMTGCLGNTGRWNRMMHEEPGTPQSPSEAQLHGFEDSQKRDEKERIAAGLPAPVVYEKRVPPPPLPKKTEAEYLTMLFGETVTDADVADLGEWMKKPEQAEISEELAQPVMFHFRAIGDRNKRLFEVWQQFKLSRRPA